MNRILEFEKGQKKDKSIFREREEEWSQRVEQVRASMREAGRQLDERDRQLDAAKAQLLQIEYEKKICKEGNDRLTEDN